MSEKTQRPRKQSWKMGETERQEILRRTVAGEAVEYGQGVRGNGRAQPLNDIAIIVVMRRFDQHELEPASG